MENDEKTMVAKDWILKLANGINPLDGSVIPDSDIVNNVHISRCLFYVSELLSSAPVDKERRQEKGIQPFKLSLDDASKVNISNSTIISAFVREINKVIPEGMKPISQQTILSWLIKTGYLIEVQKEDGGKSKRPTERGVSIGITTAMKDGVHGPYVAVEYNSNAQRFILDNIPSIIAQ